MVDIVLGLVERLYSTGSPRPAAVRVRSRRTVVPVIELPQPRWQDVLYRGAAATATGQHVSDATGSFRIVAAPADPPSRHDRRASDRMARAEGPGRGRRATDPADHTVQPLRRDRRATEVSSTEPAASDSTVGDERVDALSRSSDG